MHESKSPEIPDEVVEHFQQQRNETIKWLLEHGLEDCYSCGVSPEIDDTQARCQTENCLLRSLMGWMSVRIWNETMADFRKSNQK